MVKKIIIVAVIAFMLAGASVTEMLTLNKFYNNISVNTKQLLSMLDENDLHIDTPENIEKAEQMKTYFDEKRRLLQTVISQLMINEFAYRVSALSAHVKMNDYNMAATDIAGILENCKLLRDQCYPHLTNIL
ncbi:MAG: hypothetical protein LBS99_07490 [Clostridiales bacterium]|jgi:hypothetical protein|nr:hypothetical protein [Clostridiales bacterium]